MWAGVNRCSIACNPKVLAGKGQTVTPLRGVLFPLGGKRHWSSPSTSVASRARRFFTGGSGRGEVREVPSRSPLLCAWIWRLIQRAVCLALHAHSGSRLYSRYIATAVCLTPRPGCLFEYFIVPPLWRRDMTAPPQCTGQRGCRAAPPDIRQQTDGRHGTLVIMYIDMLPYVWLYSIVDLIIVITGQKSRD